MLFKMDREEELRLLKHLTHLAWQTASFAEEMFHGNEDLSEFTKEI